VLLAGLSLLLSLPAEALAQKKTSQQRFVQKLDRMMVQLAPQSTRASKTIRQAYKAHLDLLVLDEFADLEGALFNGGLAPLPSDPRFNLAPRYTGAFPIGEKDLDNQVSYIAARPATIGALLAVASRVKSGPIEVTSLVRHSEYQASLSRTNVNATTSVPMHTMGLAFDIALVNTPLERAYEIRDVLLKMRNAGDILFIGERKQLVFHVVPHPSRLGYFTEVYARAVGTPASANGAHVVAFSQPARASGKLKPAVSAEIIAVLPTTGFGEEWWAAGHAQTDLEIDVAAPRVVDKPAIASAPAPAPHDPVERRGVSVLPLFLAAFGGLFATGAAQRRPRRSTVLNPRSSS
jgi:hypothetical protein